MSKKYLGGYLVANTTSIPSPSGDPQFNQVTLLLHGDGTNGAQNNTFRDSSTNNFTITRNGNTTQGSFSPYGSLWSNYLGGAGNYFTVPSTLSLASNNYTIEFWFCGSQFEMTWGTPGGYAPIVINSGGDVYFADSTNTAWDYNVNGFIIKTNTWHHYALVRISSNVYIYRDGVRLGSYTQAAGNTTIGNVTIGLYNSGTTGYISNFRCVSAGVYTEAFTPSTSPLTAITNTVLLVCQSNRFVDNSTNNYALTITGVPTVQRFSPFSPSSAYSASTNGGSMYTSGATGNYLSSTLNSSGLSLTGNMTIQGWMYVTTYTNEYVFAVGTGSYRIGLQLYNNLIYVVYGDVYTSKNTTQTQSTYLLNSWHHFAVVRNGNDVRLYIDGIDQGSYGTIATNPTNYDLYVADGAAAAVPFYGYLSNIVFTQSAVYTAAFIPPTAPVSTGTVLLNFTNGGIYDNAMMNDLETVGSAQVSTSVYKYGTGSMSFDGSSSYLQGPVNPSYAFSTGNFTVEFWVYVTSYTATATTVVRTAGTSGWVCQFDGTNKMIFYANGTAQLTDSASPSTGTWTYFAVVRSGSTLTMYRNGTSVASTTYATAINPTGVLLVGCGGDSNNAAYGLNGYIDDLRITKGYARTITTPTTAFPNTYSATASVVPTATSAPGIWTLEQAAYYKNLGLWPTPP